MKLHTVIMYLHRREYITPHFIRIYLRGGDVKPFEVCTIGVNNKIFIPPQGVNEVHIPKFNLEKGVFEKKDPTLSAIVRTYTHRGIDLQNNELVIDFVAHGDNGPASNWAINAPIGAPLGVSMKLYEYELFPQADWYALIGDATAIPVLSAILEQLPATAKGIAYIEVPSEEDIQQLTSKADIKINWLINPTTGVNSQLVAKLKTIPDSHIPVSRFAYVAAEYDTVKKARHYLRDEKGWGKDEVYTVSYWKYKESEDQLMTTRRNEVAE